MLGLRRKIKIHSVGTTFMLQEMVLDKLKLKHEKRGRIDIVLSSSLFPPFRYPVKFNMKIARKRKALTACV